MSYQIPIMPNQVSSKAVFCKIFQRNNILHIFFFSSNQGKSPGSGKVRHYLFSSTEIQRKWLNWCHLKNFKRNHNCSETRRRQTRGQSEIRLRQSLRGGEQLRLGETPTPDHPVPRTRAGAPNPHNFQSPTHHHGENQLADFLEVASQPKELKGHRRTIPYGHVIYFGPEIMAQRFWTLNFKSKV